MKFLKFLIKKSIVLSRVCFPHCHYSIAWRRALHEREGGKERGGGWCGSVVEHLSSLYEALGPLALFKKLGLVEGRKTGKF